MANANHKSRPVVTERFVTVQESARHHSLSRVLRAIRAHRKLNTTYYPWIKLAGVWFVEDAGFEAGERVRITVEEKRLITTPM
ncbi:SymE family type I addiction module toxin [Burkholderia cenocepacia]|uniref:SymE family type I addiction module toxin n=1 Tax=Burkholderia cenocepacia TaxID=95486 RepID=UPI00158B79F1|nr:SymE family type I addiction module toxin [Burkholderia cenocepacia]